MIGDRWVAQEDRVGIRDALDAGLALTHFQPNHHVGEAFQVKVHYSHLYSSSDLGTNENRIGILRQYLPKKSKLAGVSQKQIKKIETEINNRPMKCLDWRTPLEVLSGQKVALIT